MAIGRAMLMITIAGLAVIAGCSNGTPERPDPRNPARAATSAQNLDIEPPPAPPRRILGGSDSVCRLPVKFATAPRWKAAAAHRERAGFTQVCQVTGDPEAGDIGALQVWLGEGTPRVGLARFHGPVSKPVYATLVAGDVSGIEVTYIRRGVKESAFALPVPRTEKTPEGLAIVTLRARNTQHFTNMRPAYVLAKLTVAVT